MEVIYNLMHFPGFSVIVILLGWYLIVGTHYWRPSFTTWWKVEDAFVLLVRFLAFWWRSINQ